MFSFLGPKNSTVDETSATADMDNIDSIPEHVQKEPAADETTEGQLDQDGNGGTFKPSNYDQQTKIFQVEARKPVGIEVHVNNKKFEKPYDYSLKYDNYPKITPKSCSNHGKKTDCAFLTIFLGTFS